MRLKWSRSRKIARQRRRGAAGLRGHALERVVDGALVRQPGQRVGRRAPLGQRQVAEVREHRRGLADRCVDAPAVAVGRRPADADEHRADDLAADQQRLADRGVRELAADLALMISSGRFAALVGAVEAHGQAGARLGLRERRPQRAVGVERDGRLEPVGAVVAVERDGRLSGIVASRWRVIRRWASDWLSVTCRASPKRACDVRNVSSASRAAVRSSRSRCSRRRVRSASSPPTTANRALTRSVIHTATRAAAPVLLVTVDLEAALVPGVGHREGVEQPVAGLLVALGDAVGGDLALGDALPLAVGRALAGDRGQLGRVVGRDARRAAQQHLHPRALLDVVLERVLGAGVEPAVERALALEEAREDLLRGLRLLIRRGRRRAAASPRRTARRPQHTGRRVVRVARRAFAPSAPSTLCAGFLESRSGLARRRPAARTARA